MFVMHMQENTIQYVRFLQKSSIAQSDHVLVNIQQLLYLLQEQLFVATSLGGISDLVYTW